MYILVTSLSRMIYWFFWGEISWQDFNLRGLLVTQVLSDTILSGHPVLSIWLSEFRILSPLVAAIFTSHKQLPLFSGCDHPLLGPNHMFV